MASMMQLTSTVAVLPGVAGTSSRARVAMRRPLMVAVRAESNPGSGGTTDKAGYAQTNAGGSGAPNPGSFANDVVEGVADKAEDAQQGAANLGSEAQQNAKNVGKDLKDGIGELVDAGKDNVDRVVNSNPGTN